MNGRPDGRRRCTRSAPAPARPAWPRQRPPSASPWARFAAPTDACRTMARRRGVVRGRGVPEAASIASRCARKPRRRRRRCASELTPRDRSPSPPRPGRSSAAPPRKRGRATGQARHAASCSSARRRDRKPKAAPTSVDATRSATTSGWRLIADELLGGAHQPRAAGDRGPAADRAPARAGRGRALGRARRAGRRRSSRCSTRLTGGARRRRPGGACLRRRGRAAARGRDRPGAAAGADAARAHRAFVLEVADRRVVPLSACDRARWCSACSSLAAVAATARPTSRRSR
jgi:hypothetical protein